MLNMYDIWQIFILKKRPKSTCLLVVFILKARFRKRDSNPLANPVAPTTVPKKKRRISRPSSENDLLDLSSQPGPSGSRIV
jgi:hypothetical protein